jgi:hypothetical protein
VAVAELELVRKSLLEALERLSQEPDTAISIAVEAVRKAFALIPIQRRREDRFSELAFKLQSLERAFRASRARVHITAPGVEREQALKDAKADLEEALSIVEQLERSLR